MAAAGVVEGVREQLAWGDPPVPVLRQQAVVPAHRDRDDRPVPLQALASHLPVGNTLLQSADDPARLGEHVTGCAPHGDAALGEKVRLRVHKGWATSSCSPPKYGVSPVALRTDTAVRPPATIR